MLVKIYAKIEGEVARILRSAQARSRSIRVSHSDEMGHKDQVSPTAWQDERTFVVINGRLIPVREKMYSLQRPFGGRRLARHVLRAEQELPPMDRVRRAIVFQHYGSGVMGGYYTRLLMFARVLGTQPFLCFDVYVPWSKKQNRIEPFRRPKDWLAAMYGATEDCLRVEVIQDELLDQALIVSSTSQTHYLVLAPRKGGTVDLTAKNASALFATMARDLEHVLRAMRSIHYSVRMQSRLAELFRLQEVQAVRLLLRPTALGDLLSEYGFSSQVC